jgi:alpha/beta hydrolase fold
LQLLIYPQTDMRAFDRPSALENEDMLTSRADMMWFTAQYVPDERTRHDPLAAPLAADDPRDLPRALVDHRRARFDAPCTAFSIRARPPSRDRGRVVRCVPQPNRRRDRLQVTERGQRPGSVAAADRSQISR